jgi:hypothetical protein
VMALMLLTWRRYTFFLNPLYGYKRLPFNWVMAAFLYIWSLYRKLTWQSRFLIEKLTVIWLVKKLPPFNEMWRFITLLTRACHRILPQQKWIQSTPFPLTFIIWI